MKKKEIQTTKSKVDDFLVDLLSDDQNQGAIIAVKTLNGIEKYTLVNADNQFTANQIGYNLLVALQYQQAMGDVPFKGEKK